MKRSGSLRRKYQSFQNIDTEIKRPRVEDLVAPNGEKENCNKVNVVPNGSINTLVCMAAFQSVPLCGKYKGLRV